MKALSLLVLIGVASQVATANPVLVKTYNDGFVPRHLAIHRKCEVDFATERLTLTRSAGNLITRTVQTFEPVGGDAGKVISAALQGQVTEQPAPTDGPTTTYEAKLDGKEVVLKAEGSRRISNSAPEAATLINLADLLCP